MPDDDLQRLLPLDLVPGEAGEAWHWRWPPGVEYALKALADGPDSSHVVSGEALREAIFDMRRELKLGRCHGRLGDGLHCFFDQILSPTAASTFFNSTLPGIAALALSLPHGLRTQQEAALQDSVTGRHFPLCILCQQQPGLVMLTQDLIAALLACSFLCLFPTGLRGDEMLPEINCDRLLSFVVRGGPSQSAKVECLLHYFARVTHQMPIGTVTFERKVLPLPSGPTAPAVPLPSTDDWAASTALLCPLEVMDTGTIEDDGVGYLQVDFANAFLGGGVLGGGCVQEEIRFMVCPELLVGMFFLPAMADNEAIEMVGAERFSSYSGYADSFQFDGDYVDTTPRDSLGRRATHLVAIDALAFPGERQWGPAYRLREVNKAFCGFLDHAPRRGWIHPPNGGDNPEAGGAPVNPAGESGSGQRAPASKASGNLGVASGNWGCGAFGGDVQLKALLQWMAATQAGQPALLYCSFGEGKAKRLQQVAAWLLRERWTVGEVWAILHDYAKQRREQDALPNLFQWLLPEQNGG